MIFLDKLHVSQVINDVIKEGYVPSATKSNPLFHISSVLLEWVLGGFSTWQTYYIDPEHLVWENDYL
jgi:hypothetical protein